MGRQHQHITYTIINPNRGCDFKQALKESIVEKLLLAHRNVSPTTNYLQSVSVVQRNV